jgi:hypothetical protein
MVKRDYVKPAANTLDGTKHIASSLFATSLFSHFFSAASACFHFVRLLFSAGPPVGLFSDLP